ncbi:DUF4363 family protein [Maledivibacter halophilus]|uniref:DUF4363 domain-containing protein n=1 Tax=Maledivibacter halophilus TaxID=36842 RepID=A0A1T5KS21_9FIRM|nr:DUF4363 family protein [Maledivibacter halophilus]SKC66199.1 protein of unknown function [Maledivibacter halophilus]
MKNNTINIVLVTLIIVIFWGYFTVINLTFEKDIIEHLKSAERYAKNEDWNNVLEVARDIKKSWNKQKHLLMFNFAEAEFAVFENHLSYIIGGAEGKQLDTTLSNILAAQDLWNNTKQFVPEP